MRSLFYSLLGYFLTPWGLVLMGMLDSSMVFFLPLGIDFAVIAMAARKGELFWLYAVLATVGSVIGAAITFWIGRKVGSAGLSYLIKPGQLKRVEKRVNEKAAISVAALAIIPPPFPFTAFILASGAFKVNPTSFFVTLGSVRLVRFMVEGALAAHYGRRVLTMMKSPTFTIIVGILIGLAIVGTIVSAVAVYRSTKKERSAAGSSGTTVPEVP
jgi:membrane protein YqaA with SNARE-associated domain